MKVFNNDSLARIINEEGREVQIRDAGSVSLIYAINLNRQTWGNYQVMKKGLVSAIFKEMDFADDLDEQYKVLFKGLYQSLSGSKPLSEVNYTWTDRAIAKGYVAAARVLLAVPRYYLFSFNPVELETWKGIIETLEPAKD